MSNKTKIKEAKGMEKKIRTEVKSIDLLCHFLLT